MTKPLAGKVAVVTGASRGAGRGVAVALGEAGATVYVTGRSISGSMSTRGWPGTIDDCARQVTVAGGKGIAVRCDHTVASDLDSLFQKIREEQGHIDILVNNVWGGNELDHKEKFSAPFWEQPEDRWPKMITAGPQAHLETTRRAVPLMLAQRGGLIINTTFYDRGKALSMLYYDLAKFMDNRLAYYMALELRPYSIAALALTPGWLVTERHPDRGTESTQYIGRAVAALAADPNVIRWTGQVLAVGDLAREYGFTDVDGSQPEPFLTPEQNLRD